MSSRRPAFLAACLIASVGAGCGGGSSSPDGAALTSGDVAFIDCAKETRATPYAPGTIEYSSNDKLAVELVENHPGAADANKPPGPWVKGSNTWTIEVRDRTSDEVVDGLQIDAVPRMPDHNHGTSITPVTTDQGGGRYIISPLYLFMSGYWKVTLDIRPPDSDAATTVGHSSAVFDVCIPG